MRTKWRNEAKETDSWSYERVLTDITRAPNTAIERLVFRGYRIVYGRRVKLEPEISAALKRVLNERNKNGIRIYATVREKRPRAITLC